MNTEILIPDRKPITLLLNPFVYIAGVQALGLGLAGILLAGVVGSFGNAHFDGVLDTHIGATAPLWVFLAEGVIDWLCLSLVLLLLGRMISRTSFRTIDLLGTQALARWPSVFISLLALPRAMQRFGNDLLQQLNQGGNFHLNTADAIIFGAVVLAMIPFLCWMVYLMYKSFSISCNLKGGKAIAIFVVGLLIAEIASKLLLASILPSNIGVTHSP